MPSISPQTLALAVLDDQLRPPTQQSRSAGNAQNLHEQCFPTHSRSAVLKAIREACDQGLIVNSSFHGARPDWGPSRWFLLEQVRCLREQLAGAVQEPPPC